MSVKLDRSIAATGTRFKLFVQPRFIKGFDTPEVVTVSTPPSEMLPGPADHRMFVVDAIGKQPYDEFSGPPYRGPRNPALEAGPDGHFDSLDIDSRAFGCATMYATVRRVLDIFQDYFGGRIEWQFAADFPKMELIPLVEWDNAQSGYGFVEFGYGRFPSGGIDHSRPYCENFDVLAHELGHSIIFAKVGTPTSQARATLDYGGFHESSADLVAITSSLHFNTVVKILLETTRGNLFTINELDRVGELGESRQIRIAFNYERYSPDVEEPHDRSLPLTGAAFDVLVEGFQKELVQRGLISADLAKRSTQTLDAAPDDPGIQAEFDAAYQGHEAGFRDALLAARDSFGMLLARTWGSLRADDLTYYDVFRQMLSADQALTNGANAATIRECFLWRNIKAPHQTVLAALRRLEESGQRSRRGDSLTPYREPSHPAREGKDEAAPAAAPRQAAAPISEHRRGKR